MSGICGIFRLDGGPPEGIAAMAAHLERRGPEGTHIFRDGPLALGHTALKTTPESLHETLPFTHAGTGCTITADLRLDNREELIAALGLDPRGRVIGDGEIVLHAYLKWGEDCPARLLGDFAFAVWDPRARHLFCARDQMGMKQLIHCHVPGRLFAFASEPKAVLKAEGVPRRINEGRIADFLEGSLEAVDLTSTFFEEVFRLPPAHCLTVSADRFDLRRYWRLEPAPELKLGSDEAYAQALLEVFTEAVRSRLRVNGPVGSMLSGGMDSGSVVAVATRLLAAEGRGPLHTFSGVGPDPKSCVETRAIHAALTMPGLKPMLVNHADLGPYANDLIRLTRSIDEPFDGSMMIPRAVYRCAQMAGVRVVLDGVGGDLCFSDGDHVPRLIRSLCWREAWRETELENQFWGVTTSTPRRWMIYQRQAWTPGWMRRLKREILRRRRRPAPLGLCRPDFAARIDLAGRQARDRDHAWLAWVSHRDMLAHILQRSHLTAGRERYERTAAACAIEPRDPFLDLRLTRFCTSLPLRQLTDDGWPKIILRRAMAELLPDGVRWRRGKEHLGWTFSEALAVLGLDQPALAAGDWLRRYASVCNDTATSAAEAHLELTHLANWVIYSIELSQIPLRNR